MITLKNLPQATAQQVFDQVARHLLTQGRRSVTEVPALIRFGSSSVCAYRGDGGLKCAAGCFIGDDEYMRDFEGKTWNKLVEYGIPIMHNALIRQLQLIHDGVTPGLWKEKLINLAMIAGLSYAVCDEF